MIDRYPVRVTDGGRITIAALIPPTTPSRAPPSPAARYARLDPDLDPDAVVLGLDLSAAEDMTVFAFRCAGGKWRPA